MTDWESARAWNMRMWDQRAPVHASSPDYGFTSFLEDPGHLSGVVRFDRPRLGSIDGLRGVHLQCHIGTDTVSLARLGARMTGLDFSHASLTEARRLAEATGAEVDFVEADLYEATRVLPASAFDLVYTGIGALCWLADIRAWANVVATLLAPGGRLFMREGHPMMWAMDDAQSDGTLLAIYPYRETAALRFEEPGTYVRTDIPLDPWISYSYNHGIGEIITSLLDEGLAITMFQEHESLPWNAFAPGAMVEDDRGEWRLIDRPERLPLSYTLQAIKPN